MHRLAVREHHDAKPTTSCFFYSCPASDSTVRLYALMLRVRDYPSNPRFANDDSVATTSNDVEVFRGLHSVERQRFDCRTDD